LKAAGLGGMISKTRPGRLSLCRSYQQLFGIFGKFRWWQGMWQQAGGRVSRHARRWYVHVASAFPQPSSIGLGSLSCTALKHLGSEGSVCPDFWKLYSFREICAILSSARGFGFKKINFGGFFPGKEAPKKHFWTEAVKGAA
jgi:hypothetical protein